MPEGVQTQPYYEPTSRGFEAKIRERLARLRTPAEAE
jgi:replication-associated recombination protein RarA